MKISEIKQAIMLCRESGCATPFIWGHRGLGKSSGVDELCEDFHMGLIDFRLGQCEASDVRGMPAQNKELGRTVYLPPMEFPQGGMTWEEYERELANTPENKRETRKLQLQPLLNEGIMFLDEANRAEDDVIQAVFQLVLDGRVGQTALPPGWSVVCSGNFMEGDYVVNGFTDAAYLDRFCHMTLSGGEHTLDEWVMYMSDKYGGAAAGAIEFASQNVKHLDGVVDGELGFSIQPSRRSWEAVIKAEVAALEHGFDTSVLFNVTSGLIGRDLAHSYSNYSCPIKPGQLVKDGIKRHEKQLNKLSRGQTIGLTWGLISVVKQRIDEDKIADVACDYASWLCKQGNDKDVVVAFCRALLTEGKSKKLDNARVAALTNKHVAALFNKVTQGNERKKSFVFRLNERPELAELLRRTIWGQHD